MYFGDLKASLGGWRRYHTTSLPPIFLTLLVAAVTIVEISLLDRRALANDEATSYFIAHLGWAEFWESLVTSEANGSPFYLLLRFWQNIGRSEAVLRILPMLFAIATIPFFFGLAKWMFGSTTAVVASLLLSLNASFLEHGQDLRGYSMTIFLITLSSWFFVRGLAQPSLGNRIGHVAASTAAVYAHFFSVLVLLAQLLTAVRYPDRRRSLPPVAVNLALTSLMASPLLVFIVASDRGQVDWIPPLSAARVHEIFLELSGMANTAGMILVAILTALGLVIAAQRQLPHPAPNQRQAADEPFAAPRWRLEFAVLWFVLPVVAALLISFFKPLLASRYLLVALPGLALATAIALTSLRRRWLIVSAGAVVLVFAGVGTLEWYTEAPNEEWAEMAEHVRAHERADDAILFYAPEIIRPFGYYAGYYTAREPISADLIYPDKYWLGYSRTRFSPPFDRIASDADKYERLWVVAGAKRDEPRAVEWQELVSRLKRTCTDLTRPLAPLRLFSGCNT